MCANQIADVRLAGREAIRRDLGVSARGLCGTQPLVGRFTTALGIRALRENVPLRTLGGDEFLV